MLGIELRGAVFGQGDGLLICNDETIMFDVGDDFIGSWEGIRLDDGERGLNFQDHDVVMGWELECEQI